MSPSPTASAPGNLRVLVAPLVLTLGLSLGAPAPPAQALVFDVNSTADGADLTPGDGLCSTGGTVNDPLLGLIPECTLRAAIGEANGWVGRDTITFASSLIYSALTDVAAFSPASDYPDVTDPVDIDGTSAPAWIPGGIPKILISGASFQIGLELQGGAVDSTVEALAFQGFGSGIRLNGTVGAWIDKCSFGYFDTPMIPGSETVIGNTRGIDVSPTAVGSLIGAKVVGSSFVGEGNVISGNTYGIRVEGPDTSIAGNEIGTDPSGNRIETIAVFPATPQPLGNTYGVQISNGAGLRLGRKLVTIPPPPDPPIIQMRGNVISGNGIVGVWINETAGDPAGTLLVQANQIGTDVDAEIALPNPTGVLFQNSITPVQIGAVFAPNYVSGNTGDGIHLPIDSVPVAVDIQLNRIGVGLDDFAAIGNGGHGIHVEDGDVLISANVIGRNLGDGIHTAEPAGIPSLAMVSIDGNWIGANAAGQRIGNVGAGIQVENTSDEITNNVIGDNQYGIRLGAESGYNTITGNYIGTDELSRDLGNQMAGIESTGLSGGHSIGLANDGNVIGWNGGSGIVLDGAYSTTEVLSNRIGVDASNGAIPNVRHGIVVRNAIASPNEVVIGAHPYTLVPDFPEIENRIAFNGRDGISVQDDARVSARGNRIKSNGDLGIDLGNDGPTPNDPGDFDTGGANELQNFPELDPVASYLDPATDELEIVYRVRSDPAASGYPLWIDFYLADVDGEEPQRFLGTDYYPMAAASQPWTVRFLPQIPLPVDEEHLIVATATDLSRRTSEVSAAITVPEPQSAIALVTGVGLVAGLARRRAQAGRIRAPAR